MTANAEQTLNVTVAQVEDALLAGQTVPDFAREWAEPPANVLAIYRRLQAEGRIPVNGPAQVATKTPVTPVAGGRALASVPTPTASGSAPPPLDALVNAAARSASKRTQALGVKVNDLATVLRQRLTDEREAAEVAERQTRERAAAAAEVARLEAALREAKAKVGGGGKAKHPSSPNRANAGRATAEKYGGEKVPCAKGCGRLVTPLPGPRAVHENKCGGAA